MMKMLKFFILFFILVSEKANATSLLYTTYKVEKRWHFQKYLTATSTSSLAKRIFLEKEWSLSEINILTLLDSLTAKDTDSRPFYFAVITKSIKRADGYYSEGLGSVGKKYIENNPQEFLNYFVGEDAFSVENFKDWAKIIALEIRVADKNFALGVKRTEKLMVQNCKECSESLKSKLKAFIIEINKFS